MWDQLFKTTNDVGVKARFGGSAEWGVCAGMSALWLKHMLAGKRDLLCVPDKNAAAIAYAKWANRQDGQGLTSDQFNTGILANYDLTVAESFTVTKADCVAKFKAKTGHFYISNVIHAMAAVYTPSGMYFFDPNEGSKKATTAADFDGVAGFVDAYSTYGGYSATWSIYKVTA